MKWVSVDIFSTIVWEIVMHFCDTCALTDWNSYAVPGEHRIHNGCFCRCRYEGKHRQGEARISLAANEGNLMSHWNQNRDLVPM